MKLRQLLGIVLLASVSAMAAATVEQAGTDSPAVPAQKRSGAPTRISDISLARSGDGLNVEITGNGQMTAKTMKLANPNRIVVDIPNSVLQGRAREIPVSGGDV